MLEIKNLTKIYPNGKKAVSNLSMTVADGDLCGQTQQQVLVT